MSQQDVLDCLRQQLQAEGKIGPYQKCKIRGWEIMDEQEWQEEKWE